MSAIGTQKQTTTWAAVAAFAVIAFALRWTGAAGPLWLDELVSLDFVTGANGPHGVFTVHDNNHVLNTLWLQLVGVDADPRLQRGLAIALGVASVPLAALLMMPRGRLAAIAAAAMVAFSTPLVVYGSEARGYAGMIAATLVLMIAADRHLAGGVTGLRWLAAAATAIGLAFQPLMAIACVGVGLAILLAEWRHGPSFGAAVSRSLAFLSPSIGAGAILVAIVGWAAGRTGVAFGGLVGFSIENFATGYAKLVGASFGLPETLVLAGPVLALVALAVAALRPATRFDVPLLVGGILLGPLAFLLIAPPNAEMARYHLGAGLAASLAMILAGRTLWLAGNAGKLAAVVLAAAWFGATIAADSVFLTTGRGAALTLVTEAAGGLPAPVRVASRRPLLTIYTLRAASREGAPAFVQVDATPTDCASPPDLVFDWIGDRPAVAELAGPDAPCGATYRLAGITKAFWLSGMDMALWRRVP